MIYLKYAKGFIDLAVGILLILLLSWLILLILIWYMITNNFPIFFRQTRIGRGDVFFTLWKFRTLSDQEENPLKERRFVLGDFLRATSLDEIPQFINVLKGEMSLIGPRPLPIEYFPLLNEEQKIRHSVRPGITGLAQVSGRHELPWQKKFELDAYYVNHVSFWLDLKIAIKTIFVLLSFKKDISLEEKPFTGS